MGAADLAQAELGVLAAGAVRAVVTAQHALDEEARLRSEEYLAAPPGSLALPPLWYSFESVSLELAVSAVVGRTSTEPGAQAGAEPALWCRTVNPTTVGLYGYQAAAGMTVRFTIGPARVIPAVPAPLPSTGTEPTS